MDFEQYIKTVINRASESEGLEYNISELVPLDPAYLPRRVASMGDCRDKIVRVPDNYISRYSDDGSFPARLCIVKVNAISANAFHGTSITDLILGENISRLSAGAFAGCHGLRRMTMPKGVRVIHKDTFKDCRQLEDVYYEGTEKEWEEIDIYTGEHRIVNGEKLGLHCAVEWKKDDGNDPLLNANVHFGCKLSKRPFMVFREASSR